VTPQVAQSATCKGVSLLQLVGRSVRGRTREGVEEVVLGSDHGVGGLVDVVLEWRT
jgi:hypothetical protein